MKIFLENSDIITKHQSGFSKLVIDEWKLIVNKKKMIGIIFIDIKRIFETITIKKDYHKNYISIRTLMTSSSCVATP